MMKTTLGTLLAVGLSAGCMINGKPLFGGGASNSANPSFAPGGGGGGARALPPPTAAPGSYAWCKGVPEDSAYEGVDKALGQEGLREVIPAIAQTLCHPTADARKQRNQIEGVRLDWMKRLGMTEQDWATDVPAFLQANGPRQGVSVTGPDDEAKWTTLTPFQQYGLISQEGGTSGALTLAPGAKHYIADALKLSELGRLAYIQYCLGESVSAWAMCQGDIDALDRAKLAAELRATPAAHASDKMIVRLALGSVDARLPAHAAKIKQLVASDPAYGTLFTVAATTRKQWQADAPKRTEILALLAALDDARVAKSKQAAKRCDTDLWAHFTRAVAALPVGSFDGIKGNPKDARWFGREAIALAVQDPDVYLAANALVTCQHDVSFLFWIQEALTNWPGARGPRTATATALLLAGIELDKADEKLRPIDIRIPYAIREAAPRKRAPAGADPGQGQGIVAAVKTQGDTMTVTMKKTSEKQTLCTQWKRTNRITRIALDGTLEYEERCLGYKQQMVDTTPGPFVFSARVGGSVAKGQYVEIGANGVEGAWAKPDAERPLAALGVTLRTR